MHLTQILMIVTALAVTATSLPVERRGIVTASDLHVNADTISEADVKPRDELYGPTQNTYRPGALKVKEILDVRSDEESCPGMKVKSIR